MRRQEAVIFVLPQSWQQCLQGRLDVSNGAERDGMTMSDMRGIEVDLNNLRPVRIELSPRKICAELKQHIAVKNSMIAGSSADHTGHTDIVGIVVRHKVLAPRGVGHWRLQSLGDGDQLVVRAGSSGAGINRDRLAAVENGRDFVEVGVARANDRLSGVDGIRPFL